jgi:hypothetical protein
LVFTHTPIPEYLNLFNGYQYYGDRNEPISCSSVNTGLFSAIKETRDVSWVFSGHDHDNDFYGNYHGVMLAYGRMTGYSGYSNSSLLKGARVIEVSMEGGGS